jgi:hypothetical protein
VEITAALAADLAILSETLAEIDADLGEGLRQLAADAKLAVRSYLGLTVTASNAAYPLTFTAMEDFARTVDVVSSLLIPLSDKSDDLDNAGPRLVVILYAGRRGAFVDLAADLCWLTGRRLSDFALDEHLKLPAELDTGYGVQAASLVNQAIGVLLGRGFTPEQAEVELEARAAAAGQTRSDAARIILGTLPLEDDDPTLGAR